jgi:uncharacterized membrane protein
MGRARVDSVDVLRGFGMVVMALDHVRGLWSTLDPVNIATTTPALFATRWGCEFMRSRRGDGGRE